MEPLPTAIITGVGGIYLAVATLGRVLGALGTLPIAPSPLGRVKARRSSGESLPDE